MNLKGISLRGVYGNRAICFIIYLVLNKDFDVSHYILVKRALNK